MSRQDSGYSLDQLLRWCEEDHLIDGFDKTDETIIIFINGGSRTLSYSEAAVLLKGIFTATQRGRKSGDIEA